MYICKVTGRLVSTIKDDNLVGYSIVMVSPVEKDAKGKIIENNQVFAAVDPIGCAAGNLVMVTKGANAKLALKNNNAPVDMAVVGILDNGLPE